MDNHQVEERNKINKFDYFIGAIAIVAFLLLILENSTYFLPYRQILFKLNFIIFSIFALDVLSKIYTSKDRKQYIKRNWFDLIVLVPIIQFLLGNINTPFSIIARQIVIIIILISRTRKANKFITLLSLKPTQLMITSFSFAIGVGTILLMLPIATQGGTGTFFVDAIFTATSATCVTGLIVKDTGTFFSLFGQLVILSLIQVGGLGIMTFSVSLTLLLRKKVDISQQIIMQDVLEEETLIDVKKLILFLVKMTFIFEFIGGFILFLAWKGRFTNFLSGVYHAFFHAISAFCNAGFSTFSDSLIKFSEDTMTNIIICLLIISGGLGFIVIKDFYEKIKIKYFKGSKRFIKMKVQTKIVFTVSLLLIIIGTIFIFGMEANNAFSSAGTKGKILLSLFQSITTRTAGFNTIDFSKLSTLTLFIMIVLMFIGASPGSTGGGIKTTTIFVLWATIISGFKQKENVEGYKRTIPPQVIQKAISVFSFSLMLVIVFTAFLLYFEKNVFMNILFETVSAFGTVGLSTGITPALSVQGKLMITILMFIGRLGPLTIGYAFTRYRRPAHYMYAEERIMIG